MKHITIGILAHVDAGKTTLSEGLLYTAGSIRQLGRVDDQNAFLDNNHMERDRGITIFSKPARFALQDGTVTLLDTPGHVDFSAEMERALQVLDYAVLVVSAADGVQSHTETLWQLFAYYDIPVFLFINKMDMPDTDRGRIMQELQEKLSDACVDFMAESESVMEAAAMCEEDLLERFLQDGTLEDADVIRLIRQRKLFPCYFGSALKMQGVETFLKGLWQYTEPGQYGDEFGARVYKISRDEQGNRLTHLKVTGGRLQARQLLQGKKQLQSDDGDEEQIWSEKINQIRFYSGEKYTTAKEAKAGEICAVTGLSHTYPGEGLGFMEHDEVPILEPVLTYRIFLEPDWDVRRALPLLKQLEEEEPELHIIWDETLKELHAQVMGEVQIEVIRQQLFDRYRMHVTFGEGNIVYKETIAAPVIGMVFDTNCSEDMLSKNWQRLILTHLQEKKHRGVLTGSEITDMRISVIAGKAHVKHTEGGDFRQATYRAVRQGLRQAETILLEPYYSFRLELPTEQLGRAMTDMERMSAKLNAPDSSGEYAVLAGEAPVATIRSYQKDLSAYTGGKGKMSCQLCGYRPCHNTEEVVAQIGYDPDLDYAATADSVFTAHGSGYIVPWDEVADHVHVDNGYSLEGKQSPEDDYAEPMTAAMRRRMRYDTEYSMGEEEIRSILGQAGGANRNQKKNWIRQRKRVVSSTDSCGPVAYKRSAEKYLLVDGYNIVFAWDELNELAKDNIDAARDRLMDILCNYQAYMGMTLILVFDAYKVKGGIGQMLDYHNIHVVYTKEAETADQYIEKLAHNMGREHDVTVATSDGLEQLIIRGQGCKLWSAREFYAEVKRVEEAIRRQVE